MLNLSSNNSHETDKGVRCNCFSRSDHQFRASPFSWKMAILALELEVYSFSAKHLFIPSSHASACLPGRPPENSGILIFCSSLEISWSGSCLGPCALSEFSHLTCVVSTYTILSDCLFSVAMMVSKDLSITPISGLEVVPCDAGGGICGGGEGGQLGVGGGGEGGWPRPRPRPRPQPLRVWTMIISGIFNNIMPLLSQSNNCRDKILVMQCLYLCIETNCQYLRKTCIVAFIKWFRLGF